MPNDDKPDLSTVTFSELADELKSRCSVMVLFFRPQSPEGEGYNWGCRFTGTDADIVLLIELGKADVMKDLTSGPKRVLDEPEGS